MGDANMPSLTASAGVQLAHVLLVALRVIVKFIAGALAFVLVALLLGFVAWEVLYFQPQRPQIGQLIASATDEERNPPETIVRLVRVDSGDRIALAAYWVLVGDPTNPTRIQPISHDLWQVRGLLWWTCVWLHLSEREQITLILSRANMGRGMRGFSAGGQEIFNRPLALLSLEEAATLMAIPRCPSCFHNKHKDWAERRDWLLSRLQTTP
jgi:transglycosylase-like protein